MLCAMIPDTCTCPINLYWTVRDAASILLKYRFIILYLTSPLFHMNLCFLNFLHNKMLERNVDNYNFINSEIF